MSEAPFESLHDRWARMSAEELRDEVFSFFRAQGKMQSMLYEDIRNLEQRIGEQRKTINRLQEERDRLAERLIPPQPEAE